MWLTLHIYFKRIVFKNIERLKSSGPLLVISNHPNTVIDPLVALYRMPTICHLLANYSLFKNPISGFLLSNLFCIPIQRYTDVPEGQALQNDEAFQKCDEHLLSGGCLYIAVEGTSWPERVLREFKTVSSFFKNTSSSAFWQSIMMSRILFSTWSVKVCIVLRG